jgi:hypothetical protein
VLVKRCGERCYQIELTPPDEAYVRTILRAAEAGGDAPTAEIVLLNAILVGLRVVAADILGRIVLRSGGNEPPQGDGNPFDA